MRIMLDTNVLISILFFPSKKFMQMLQYITQEHQLVLSSFVTDELIAVAEKKFPSKKKVIDKFLTELSYEFVYTPKTFEKGLFEIRDINDYPVLYTAIIENIDIFITGDKDFTDVDIEKPRIMAPSDFIDKYVTH
ncbi:MAG: putative toxin-antitoxin system toxin component, PIN family [Firmicutes bacterium]|nr:putative toxin-antitoxin system toxin component, PIN family [Bacillota bacterium]